MKSKLLLTTVALLSLTYGNFVKAQNVSILTGEVSNIETQSVFNSDFGPSNTAGSGFSCNFNKGRGILSIGAEIQSDGYASWDEIRVAFYYNGSWKSIYEIWANDNQVGCDWTGGFDQRYYTNAEYSTGAGSCNINASTTYYTNSIPGYNNCTMIGKMGGPFSDRYQRITMYNNGNLQVYNGNYLPQSGVIQHRSTIADNNMWGIQSRRYTATGTTYPCFNDPNPATKKSTGYDVNNYKQFGNIEGFVYNQFTGNIGVVIINIANLPPDMLEAPNFKVHIYAKENGNNHNRIYETTYSNQNFMTQGPIGLTASKNLCGKVTLNWSNSNNVLPDDGNVTLKNVIFRNGAYLTTIAGNLTSYDDASAVQDVEYDYTVRHVAFSETGETYYKSPLTVSVKGSVKPSPDEPITPSASIDKCTGKIDLAWGFNGTNPDRFRIVYSTTSSSGPFTNTLTSTLSGGSRSYAHTGVTRGQNYYYRIYAINSCSVLSTTYASCNGISPADPAMATNVLATGNATGAIDVTWLDNANNETKYQIVRTDDEGNTILTDINPNQTSYTDASAAACRLYTYKIRVFNDCVLSGIVSTSQDTAVLPPPNLQTTFTATKKLVASKGYFGNRVELSWSNNNGVNIDIFKIYRKQLGTALDSVQIASLGTGSALYIDNTADARIFYRYTIVGLKQCNGAELLTNISSDIGFRNPTGIVSGHIEYNGGVAVGGAKVFVNSTNGNAGSSLNFSNNGTISIPASATNSLTNEMRCEFWMKPNGINGLVLNKANEYSFGYNGSSYEAKLYTSANPTTAITIGIPNTYTSSTSSTNTGTTVATTTVNPGYTNTTTVSTSTTANTSTTITAVTNVNNVSSSYTLTTVTTSVVNTIITNTTVVSGQWTHVALIYNGSQFKTLINGQLRGTQTATGNIVNTSNPIVFGDATSNFKLDEFRLIGKAETDSVINLEVNRILNGDEPQFKTNLHFDEGFGGYAYDPSKVGNLFNGNHAAFTGTNVVWSSDIPTASQLGYYGVTNALGNYNVSGIRYLGTGENYNLVPQYQTHAFSPNTRAVYIGDASYVYNNQDFIDISSFPFTGTIFYKNTTCPVPGAALKIDGLPVVKNGVTLESDANGTFSISVPIGNHFVSIEKFGHDMEEGRYPAVGTHNFQAPISAVEFVDSTLRTIVGRVVGGLAEATKLPGMKRSKNNIGQAKIQISSPVTGIPCFTKAVITNSVTGEYVMRVPPLNFKVDSLFIVSNKNIIGKNQFPNSNQLIDLIGFINSTKIKDSLKASNGSFISLDSVSYHIRKDYVYRSAPVINVTKGDGVSTFIGEDSLNFGSTKVSITPTVTNSWGPMGLPVFEQGSKYVAKVFANELYTNTDNSAVDTVKLNGTAFVVNEMVNGNDPNSTVNIENGVGSYSFTCGAVNTASNVLLPLLSYASKLEISVVPDGAAQKDWLPNSVTSYSGTTSNYYAYVVGQKITGTGIATQGPERVDFILRDPPGSGSSATWATGTAVNLEFGMSIGFSVENNLSASLSVGTKQSVGIGVETEVEVENKVGLGMQTTVGASLGAGYTESVESSYQVATRDDADNVGAPADIFIGRSRNWLVGVTSNIELQTAAQCSVTGRCFGQPFNGYQLANMAGYAVAPADVKTRFSYTQNEIETVVIPTLESIRNTILSTNSKYTSHISSSDSRFGSNNDDPLWGASASSTNPAVYDKVDTTGSSYTFRGRANFAQDTVRVVNNQIRIWKEALAQNEKEKWQCVSNAPHTGSSLLDNFTLGSAVVTNAYTTQSEASLSESFELTMTDTETSSIGAKFNNTGAEVEQSITLTQTINGDFSQSFSNSTSFEYTLTDGDPGDIMSIDVYKTPKGNVFITRGGQTMCPYEDAMVCHYFNPNNPSAWISSHSYNTTGYYTLANATVQREMPNISLTPAIQYNIPSNQQAVFQLILSNQSPLTVNNDIDLQVRVDGTKNPFGAVCKIDGQNADNIYNIPSGGSLVKTLTIERGPIEINYDSLMIIFSSACSSDIADTAYVSVHFIPTCTDLSINTPVDNFVINNNNFSLQNVVIDNYNYNFGAAQNTSTVTGLAHPSFGIEKIGFEFKPANSSQWLQVRDFFKYPNAVGSNSLYPIPQGQVYTQYGWTVTPQSYADGNYEIRAISYCYNKDGSYATVYSPVHSGVMDRINPHPFGTPSPGDGILDPNDDISIQFNEPIDISSLSYAPVSNPNSTFDIRGVLNGTNIRHSESLNFDGTSDYAEVLGGASLQKRNFTFEFWAKLNATNVNQTVISQGTDANQRMSIGFDNSNKLVFNVGNQAAATSTPIALPTDWHHYAVSYDYANTDVSLYVDGTLAGTNNNFVFDYEGTGKLAFGKALPANNEYFGGNLHEVRLWNKTKTSADVTTTMNTLLNRNQANLVYNWKMDEADGAFAKDDIRSRDANIYGATWEVNPNGSSASLDGVNDYLEVSSGSIPITKEMDCTLEFWFNSNQSSAATLFSNGKADGIGADSLTSWNIDKDASGQIHVKHKGLDFVAVNTNYFDGSWHHFALVLQRTGNLSAYVDGNLQNSVPSTSFNEIASGNMYLGVRSYFNGSVQNLSNYYQGQLDEFRFWNTSRKTEQLKRDKQNRMLGDEHGLQAFVPFEHYAIVLGTPSLTPTFNNQSLSTLTVTPMNGPTLVSTTPKIKLPRPVQSVNFTYSLNNDKIILTTTTDPALIENVTLDITVKNAYDMHGNKMQSPKTWIAYINKNQVKWQDDEFTFEKTTDEVVTFTAPIVNSGGALKAFTIGNIPSWMTASATTGNIAPNTLQNIVFTMPAGTNIGDYTADVSLTTDFGFDEMLRINLKVKGTPPTWTVNPSDYQYSMSVFGQFKIDNVISTNPESMIAALNNGTVVGVANLQYVAAYDKYEAYLSIYDNTITGDSIKFNIYDASTGLTFVNVTPSLMFVENDIQGTAANPITFVANTQIRRDIALNAGWTWVSFPLSTPSLANSNLMMSQVQATTNDVVAGDGLFDQYDSNMGWLGSISQGAGFKNNRSYKVKVATMDTIVHIGTRIHPDSAQAAINVIPGWNWIGYISNKNTPVNEALGNYNATTGDIIKSQYQFAYYDNLIGWVGSLTHLKPTLGYMLKSTGTSTFHYPLSSYLQKVNNTEPLTPSQSIFPFTPEMYDNTMSAIVTGNICNESLEQGNVALGAFDNVNTLRGFALPMLDNTTNKYNYYLTTYSNTDGEVLNIKYFNTTNGSILPTTNTITFTTNSLAGTPSNPIKANVPDSLKCNVVLNTTTVNELDASTNLSVYPNPFSDNVTIRFNKAVTCDVELVDMLGKVVYSSLIKNKKEYNMALDASRNNISAGMYYIRLTGDVNEQIKVVKTR